MPRWGRTGLGAGAAVSGVLATAVVLGLAGPAAADAVGTGAVSVSAVKDGAGRAVAVSARAGRRVGEVVAGALAVQVLPLRAMPAGTVRFGRTRGGRLTVRADLFGLTPGSSHLVEMALGSGAGGIRFGVLRALRKINYVMSGVS